MKRSYILMFFFGIVLLSGCGSGESGELNSDETGFYSYQEKEEEPESNQEQSNNNPETEETDATIPRSEADNEVSEFIVVHVCGAVFEPGVYALQPNSRIADAIDAAGGFLPQAAMDELNLAEILLDEDKIIVHTFQELLEDATTEQMDLYGEGTKEVSQQQDLRININTAGEEELMTLSGIGASRAKEIISYREKNQGFSTIEEIMNISGIKEATFDKIKDDIRVN